MEMERTQVKDSILIPPNVQPTTTMEFLSRSWSLSATEITKAITLPPPPPPHKIKNIHHPNYNVVSVELTRENEVVAANPFCNTSHQLIMDRIMSHSQKGSPCNSRRVSHSSDSPPVSPCDMDHEFKYFGSNMSNQYKASAAAGSSKTVGRWLKDRREKRKEETRAQNAQLHAAISVAGVASAVAAIAAATAMSSRASKDKERAVNDTAVASAATLVAAQCVEAAEAMGAEREYLVSVVRSAVNVRSAGDIMTLTAAAATALRAAATLKARALKEVWNITGVIPSEKGIRAVANDGKGWSDGSSNSSFSGELVPEEDFLGICSRELLAKGCELLKKTRNGDLHWKMVSVYINRIGQVILKMKSRHVAGTVTKKKKNVVLDVLKDTSAWPGRHLLEGGEHRRYFALKTVARGVVEFECRNQRECDVWTQGVSRLLKMVAERNNRHRF